MTIEIDGAQGEGGGQILRTALTLSMCTGKPIRINNIRAKRAKPGLLRQHLTAVQAATAISSAKVEGVQIGSTCLSFAPQTIQGGKYRFSIGTAGSCTLVLQTILPALLMAKQASEIHLSGGTHNSNAPPFHFLQQAFLPLLHKMGAKIDFNLIRFGFYPAGGGEIRAHIQGGAALKPLHLLARGNLNQTFAESFFAALPAHIAQRELAIVQQDMDWQNEQLLLREIHKNQGPGNVLLLNLNHEHVIEVFSGFGERGVSAEAVAEKTIAAARRYLSSTAAVSGYLADQLLLPMALAGGGSFTTHEWSEHAETNAAVVQRFLAVNIVTETLDEGVIKVTVTAKDSV